MNKVVLIGRLVRDPELKFTPGTGTAVTNFTMAVDRKVFSKDAKKEADFIPVIVWGKQAESVANYVSKGKLIGVSGRIQTRSYDAKDGSKRFVTEIVAEEVQFLEWGGGQKERTSTDSYNPSGMGGSFEDEFMSPVDDGEIPF
ncbi:MAG: single-stranded DNA-binding protein [Clostridiaceae bacterium]